MKHKVEKNLTTYRNKNGERGSKIISFNNSEEGELKLKNFIIKEIFNYEIMEDEVDELEAVDDLEAMLGFSKKELESMQFEEFVIAIHKFYIISINFDVIEKPVEEGFGGALPFTD